MTLIVISASKRAIVVGADSRFSSTMQIDGMDVPHEIHLYFDATRKLFFFPSPHNYVVVSISGTIQVRVNEMFTQFVTLLRTQQRMSIREYAEFFAHFYLSDPSAFKGNYELQKLEENNFIFSGYDASSDMPMIFRLSLPLAPVPRKMLEGNSGTLEAGNFKYADQAQDEFRRNWIRKIEKKQLAAGILGGSSLNQQEIALLRVLRSGKLPVGMMTPTEMVEYANHIIAFTSEQLTHNNEPPGVGGATNIVSIIPNKGVQVVKLEDLVSDEERPLANTNFHHLVIECCSNQVPIQLDFIAGNELVEGFKRLPSSFKFMCPICLMEHNIEGVQILAGMFPKKH